LRQRGGQGEGRWWIGALAALGVCAVVLGIVLVAVTISRRGDEPTAGGAAPGASAASGSSGTRDTAPAGAASAMPHSKLLTDDERFRSLLAQVHGRGGKESAELRALLDEQASIAAQALQPGCVGPQCSALKEVGKLVTNTNKKRVKRRSRSPDALRSRWLAGLEMPEIPVEDDPRVQKRFEFYTENPLGRETFQQMLFRCGAYKDAIQSTLIRRGLPKDLIAVAYAESGCYPLAKSPMGAEGLWQFIPEAARAYHLRIIDGIVDERHSPQKATEAAIQYFSDMYVKFGEWDLVFAAYNCGPFGLAARIEQVDAGGGKVGFWELVDAEMLPGETADYAPAIQAIALILNNLQKLKFGAIQQRAPQMTMDLPVPPNTRLSLVARAAATSLDELRRLNLDIKGTSTPNVQNFAVQVSKDSVWQARETLQELLKTKDDSDMCAPQNFDWGRQRFTPEMQEACRRTLGARAAASAAASPSPP
jgi:soluble lytic murein transglycosylase-like protein